MENVSKTIMGIQNLGNMCYLNSVLQVLFNIDSLNKFIIKTNSISKNDKGDFLNLYKKILFLLDFGKIKSEIDEENVLDSSQIKDMLGYINKNYENYYQQDAHETLMTFLSIFHEGFENTKTFNNIMCTQFFTIPLEKIRFYAHTCWEEDIKRNKYSILCNLFKGQLRQQITCQECLTEYNNFECFNDISIPLPNYNTEYIDIYTCLEDFCNTEYMLCENMYYCETCEKEVEALKKTSFWKLPKYLIIHFNRFIQNCNKINKNSTKIKFPIYDLNIKNNLFTAKYNLISTIKHHGNCIESGHYSSYIFDKSLNKWFHLDDEELETVNEICEDPYILIYEHIL